MSASDSRPAASATASAGAPEGQDTSAAGSAVQGTAERQALCEVLWPFRELLGDLAWDIADAVLAAGYRLLVEDEDTVERLAAALMAGDECEPREGYRETWLSYYREMARAALQALRGDK